MKPLQIGPYLIATPLALAPMAGVTDRPFRLLCRSQGAGHVVSEMVTSKTGLWETRKSKLRRNHDGEPGPITVQIVGHDPQVLAEAAQACVADGAQIVDINMGCPAKKVCNRWAGSALMQDEQTVAAILQAVVAAVDVPVTLKIRTGWSRAGRNGPVIARIAEDAGIAMLAVHGRTREDKYLGDAEYDTIAEIKQTVSIPVLANGDITTPEKARFVFEHTGCDGIMIGRGAHGRPWIFNEIAHYLRTGQHVAALSWSARHRIVREHLLSLYEFYGADLGVRFARKHVTWYAEHLPNGRDFSRSFNALTDITDQQSAVDLFFSCLSEQAAPSDFAA